MRFHRAIQQLLVTFFGLESGYSDLGGGTRGNVLLAFGVR